jgi:hypothetical protein
MKYKLFCASCMMGVAVIGAAPAYAGPPNAECGEAGATSTPGNAATSPGSVFNEPGTNSANGGTGNQAYNNAGAPSQYDVACAKVTAAGAGTPMQTTAPPDVITNNARDNRAISHTGKGANK